MTFLTKGRCWGVMREDRLWLVLLFVVSLGLRLYGIDRQGVWHDERESISTAGGEFVGER